MAAVAFLVLAACALPAYLFLEFRGRFSTGTRVGISFALILIWFVCLASSRIRQETLWDGSGLVLWNYISRFSFKRVIGWSEIRSIQVRSLGTSDGEAFLEIYCLRGIYRSAIGDQREMARVKEAILIEQARSAEGKAFVNSEFKRKEKIMRDRLIRIKQSMSTLNKGVLFIVCFMIFFFCAGFWYNGVAKNPFPYGFAIAGLLLFCNYIALQFFRFELGWDDESFILKTMFLGIASEKRLERSKVVSISSSTFVSGETEYSCLRFECAGSGEDVIFAKRIHPRSAQWIEETLQVLIAPKEFLPFPPSS